MHYSILIYGPEQVFERLPEDEREKHLQNHRDLQQEDYLQRANSQLCG